MTERPLLHLQLDVDTFRKFYYLKEELIEFCRQQGLQTTGGKGELTERIAHYLATGEKTIVVHQRIKKKDIEIITKNSKIEFPFVCSEKHRAFFKEEIGTNFSFNVEFQKWLKNHTGKTYQDAIVAYHMIIDKKKNSKTIIDQQFEYNTYIRAFFADNPDKTLRDAIACWKYKKSIAGHNRYEKTDLKILNDEHSCFSLE